VIVAELLNEVQAKGIILIREGDALHYQGQESSLTPALIGQLRERKQEIISLLKCGWCRKPLSGAINQWWRILLNAGPLYLCSASCVHESYPWRLEVPQ
jgi:hypothetical protein